MELDSSEIVSAADITQALSNEEREKGFITASAGNHALALCHHGKRMGIPVTVCMPINAPAIKVAKCQEFGSTVIINGEGFDETKAYSMDLAEKNHLTYVNGFDHPYVISGQGTVLLEVMDQVPDIDAIIVPVGGGGLIAGICAAAEKIMKRKIQIIGVESKLCSGMSEAISQNGPVGIECSVGSTLADGLCVKKVGSNTFRIAASRVDRMIQVEAMTHLVEDEKCVVEGAGAVGIAAFLEGQLDYLKGKKVVVILSGSNVDASTLARVIETSLVSEGRIANIVVSILDKPCVLSALLNVIATHRASVRDILVVERSIASTSIFEIKVALTLEFQNREHGSTVKMALKELYGDSLAWNCKVK